MPLPVANSQPVVLILPLGGVLAAFLPGRLHILNSVTAMWQGLSFVFEGLRRLRPSRDPTCSLAVRWSHGPEVPKRGQLVPLWYLSQNVPDGKDAGSWSFPIIPKRFHRPVSITLQVITLAVKSLVSVLELQMQRFRHSNCIQQRKGTPYHDRRRLRPHSLLARNVRRTREPRNATCPA
jgi:hypothetical protein